MEKQTIEPQAAVADNKTYVDDGDLCIFRHPFDRLFTFETILNIGDAASNLTLKTPDGCHEARIELRCAE